MDNTTPLPNDASTTAQVQSQRWQDQLVPVRTHRFAFWRTPTYVSMSWLREQAELAEQAAELEFRQVKLMSELHQFQQHVRLDRHLTKGMKRWAKAVTWASLPSMKNQSRVIPGLGLELCIISAFVSLGLANLMV